MVMNSLIGKSLQTPVLSKLIMLCKRSKTFNLIKKTYASKQKQQQEKTFNANYIAIYSICYLNLVFCRTIR